MEIQDGSATFEVQYAKATFIGMILAFAGTFKDGYPIDAKTGIVRQDWHLCDGTNGTPDLRDKFILGGDGTNNGITGGMTETNHKHVSTIGYDENNRVYFWEDSNKQPVFGSEIHDAQHSIMTSNSEVSGKIRVAYTNEIKITNMPPYYTLAYIMKL